MSPAPPPSARTSAHPMPPAAAVVLDLVLVMVFAAIGRASHDSVVDVAGVAATGWPFVVGAVVGWAIAWGVRKVPPMNAHDGVLVWLSTLVIGMALRVLTGGGTAVAFVVVAGVSTAVLLLGWRFVADQVVRRRG